MYAQYRDSGVLFTDAPKISSAKPTGEAPSTLPKGIRRSLREVARKLRNMNPQWKHYATLCGVALTTLGLFASHELSKTAERRRLTGPTFQPYEYGVPKYNVEKIIKDAQPADFDDRVEISQTENQRGGIGDMHAKFCDRSNIQAKGKSGKYRITPIAHTQNLYRELEKEPAKSKGSDKSDNEAPPVYMAPDQGHLTKIEPEGHNKYAYSAVMLVLSSMFFIDQFTHFTDAFTGGHTMLGDFTVSGLFLLLTVGGLFFILYKLQGNAFGTVSTAAMLTVFSLAALNILEKHEALIPTDGSDKMLTDATFAMHIVSFAFVLFLVGYVVVKSRVIFGPVGVERNFAMVFAGIAGAGALTLAGAQLTPDTWKPDATAVHTFSVVGLIALLAGLAFYGGAFVWQKNDPNFVALYILFLTGLTLVGVGALPMLLTTVADTAAIHADKAADVPMSTEMYLVLAGAATLVATALIFVIMFSRWNGNKFFCDKKVNGADDC